MLKEQDKRKPSKAIDEKQLSLILQLSEKIHYGSIELIFQDGVLIQIEEHKKLRMR